MAEKRVSVRLVAVGGRLVKAELEGIGDTGTRSFARLSAASEAANARLAGFARTARFALIALGTAAVASGVAMVRSGIDTIDAQAKLAQSFGTTTRAIQVLQAAGDLAGVSMEEVTAASKKLTINLSEAAGGTGSAVKALEQLNLKASDLQKLPLDERIAAIQAALVKFVPAGQRAAVASDLFGAKAALAFSRIDAQTLRDAARDVDDFGVAVSEVDAGPIQDANDAIARLGMVGTGLTNQFTVALAPAVVAVANVLADAARKGGALQLTLQFLGQNIGQIASIAGAFATFFAGRFVVAMASAALGINGMAFGLAALRAVLLRTGIGILIVGAGELVYWFGKLVSGAGGFGAALGLLADLASEVWTRIGLGAALVSAKIAGTWYGLKAIFADVFQSALESVTGWGNTAVGIFEGAFDAVKAIWGKLPAAIADFAFQAANGLIGGVEAMLNAVVNRINTFINGLNAALSLLPEWATGAGGVKIGTLDPVQLGRVDNPYAGAATAAGAAAAEAFQAALGKTYIQTPDLGLGATANDARGRSAGYSEAAGMLADAATRPLASWQALSDAVTKSGEDSSTALGDAGKAAGDLGDGLDETTRKAGGAGKAGKAAGEDLAAAAAAAKTGWAAVTNALADYATKAKDISADVGQALVGAFQSAEDAVGEFVKTGKFDFKSLVTSILADLAKLVIRKSVLGPLANLLSGALGKVGGGILGSVLARVGLLVLVDLGVWCRQRPLRVRLACMTAALRA